MFSKYLKAFIDKHFQELYEKYMQLKENREFSKEDILNLFSEITRGDLHFDKVSQNIDEMYLSLEEIQKAIEEARQKYNPDDLFKNKKNEKLNYKEETEEIEKTEETEEKRMVIVQEEKWYKKIFNIIKGIFKRK